MSEDQAQKGTLVVNQDTCISCGTCIALCPKVFDYNSAGKSGVKDQNGASADEIKQAISMCPVAAISYHATDEQKV